MSRVIDLSVLPAPNVVEPLDFEAVLAQLKAIAIDRSPQLATVLQYESEPVTKLLEVYAYRELLLRQRINDAARSVMLAYAKGADLDQIAARYGVRRLLIQAGDREARPPVEAVFEDDAAFQRRILLSLDAFTTAGSKNSYIYHALSADGNVLDADAISPVPGKVTVFVLSRVGDGSASPELLATVQAALNADLTRPMTDEVTVLSASIIDYSVAARLYLLRGPDVEVVTKASRDAAAAYAQDVHVLGAGPSISGIYRSLHQPGVLRAELLLPARNLALSFGQAAHCTGITLTAEVLDD